MWVIFDFFCTCSHAKQQGYVRTIMGRIRHLPEIRSADSFKASTAERQAVNSIIQGTASDIIKLAMINVDMALSRQWPKHFAATRLVMQIHDELIYEVSNEDADCLVEFKKIVRTAMEEEVVKALNLTVPLVVNFKAGQTWGDMS